ncbi:MAG TPA: GNAT family N-acetyltransferase [Steroidobacteraceae bacterium]|jgi:ribosomal protein S18 acetylase RimI-like enzyme
MRPVSRRILPVDAAITYAVNRAGVAEVAAHLAHCDAHFVPPLSGRVDIDAYAAKIAGHAERFEAWAGRALVGMVAAYCNDRSHHAAFITSVSVAAERRGEGIATRLLEDCIQHARRAGFTLIRLSVDRGNAAAIRLYERCGFAAGAGAGAGVPVEAVDIPMILDLSEVPERHARL